MFFTLLVAMFCTLIAVSRMYMNFVEGVTAISRFQQSLPTSKFRANDANIS